MLLITQLLKMHINAGIILPLVGVANAARPMLWWPDTLAEVQYGTIEDGGALPNVSDVIGLPDFQYLAEGVMNISAYTYYHSGAAGEWSYRNNLEAFQRMRLRPRVMRMVSLLYPGNEGSHTDNKPG